MKTLHEFVFENKAQKKIFIDSSGKEYSVYSSNIDGNTMNVTYDGKSFVSLPILTHLKDKYSRTLSDSERFQIHLHISSKIVSSWPTWKQECFGCLID